MLAGTIAPTDLRLFAAILLQPALHTAVTETAGSVRRAVNERLRALPGAGDPMKWVAPESLHLTLKFLGEAPQHVLVDIDEAVRRASAAAGPMRLAIAGVGAFPSAGRPRVVWLGGELGGPIKRLRRELDDALAASGFARETRQFSAHLTLGRVRDAAPPEEVRAVGEAVQRLRPGAVGEQPVGSIALVRSELFPTGPRYTRLIEYALGSGEHLFVDELAARLITPAAPADDLIAVDSS